MVEIPSLESDHYGLAYIRPSGVRGWVRGPVPWYEYTGGNTTQFEEGLNLVSRSNFDTDRVQMWYYFI